MEDWKSCPACKLKRERLRNELDSKYGRITKEEYSKLQEQFEQAIESDDGDVTLRFEYEYNWLEDATLVVKFSGKCKRCEATWELDAKVKPNGNA